MNDFASKERPAALVTGGAVRVGRAICLALARGGFDVAVHHHESSDAARRLVGEMEGMGAKGCSIASDLTRPAAPAAAVREAVELLGRLDLLVNNAAIFVDDTGEVAELARMKVLNFDAVQACTDAAVEHLADTRGCVVHISDVAGVIPFKRYKAYSRTKSALLDLAQRQALELCVRGVRVNVVCPGSVLFPERYTEALRRSIIAEIPLGRAGRAEDVAEAVAFLARATFVTGQCLAVDGGRLLTGLAGLAVPGGARSLH